LKTKFAIKQRMRALYYMDYGQSLKAYKTTLRITIKGMQSRV